MLDLIVIFVLLALVIAFWIGVYKFLFGKNCRYCKNELQSVSEKWNRVCIDCEKTKK